MFAKFREWDTGAKTWSAGDPEDPRSVGGINRGRGRFLEPQYRADRIADRRSREAEAAWIQDQKKVNCRVACFCPPPLPLFPFLSTRTHTATPPIAKSGY
jgi:hypothetical protein